MNKASWLGVAATAIWAVLILKGSSIFREGFDRSGLIIRPGYASVYLRDYVRYQRDGLPSVSRGMNPPKLMHRYVAHGLGATNTQYTPNTRDAFIQSYQQGFRLFEIDFIYSVDGHLISHHDRIVTTYKRFVTDSNHLDVARLKGLLKQFPDAVVIIDFKQNYVASVSDFLAELSMSKDESLLRRVVFQVYSPFDYFFSIRRYPNIQIVYTNYKRMLPPDELLSFLSVTGQKTVVIPVDFAVPSTMKLFNAADIQVYVHTINSSDAISQLAHTGVDGFFVDRLP